MLRLTLPRPRFLSFLALLCLLTLRAFAADTPAAANPPPAPVPWWREVDTGPFISDTFRSVVNGPVIALKGIAIKLGPERNVTAVFDTELLAWRTGFEGTIALEGTPWSGSHGGSSFVPPGQATMFFFNPAGRGAAANGDWSDRRDPAAGPLPHDVARYKGLYRHGNDTVLYYAVGNVKVLEVANVEDIAGVRALTRTLNTDATPAADLEFLVRDQADPASPADKRLKTDVQIGLFGAPAGVSLETTPEGRATVRIAKGTPSARFKIIYAAGAIAGSAVVPARDLATLTQGGPAQFPQTFAVKGQLDPAPGTKSYAVDLIPLPAENPWKSPPRFGGFDFFADGKRIAASSWTGDVWIADGIDGDLAKVTWRRCAAGLYQTLGLKIVDGVIYTQGRDQITRLHDLNGDGEADFYECFNNDVMITSGFHEFSFDLQTDRDGNFYFSKAMPVLSGGRGFGEWTDHNGSVLKVSKDGSKLERVAWGFRAPGGLGISPDGVITTGENEGSWVPACKISWTKPGTLTFNGVVPSKWDRANWVSALPGAPTDYDKPLCWLPYSIDNSSGSQVWVPENTKWDPRHAGEMLHLSYGKSTIFRVLREEVNGQVQGGVYRLPIDIAASAMRARFHPTNGQLYVVGFRGWQTNGRDALQRVRFTGITTPEPVGLNAYANGLLIRFSAPLDPKTAEDPSRYSVSKWNYVWGPQYGSGRFSIDDRDVAAEQQAITVPSKGAHNVIDTVTVGAAKLLDDGRAVFLYLPKMTAAMQMEVKFDLLDAKGAACRDTIYNTVHNTSPEYKIAGVNWNEIAVAPTMPTGEPGLVLNFDAETTDAVAVPQIALTVPAGTAPSVFLNPRGFGASWRGTLVVPERDEYTFALEGTGAATLQIDGKVIVSGELPLVAKTPLPLAKGGHAIFTSYKSPRQGEARVRLMWSSALFRPEPVPAAAFRYIPNAELDLWGKVRAGRQLFAAAQCVRCHQASIGREWMPELSALPPDFADIGNRIETTWLEQWVRQPQGRCPSVATDRAPDVAAYLATLRDGATTTSPAIPQAASKVANGQALVEKLHLGFWTEPLTRAHKHTDAGLIEQLTRPALHHPDTTFPDVRLSTAEAADIAAFIRSKQPKAAATATHGDATAGKAIVDAKCAACHAPTKARLPIARLDEIAKVDWTVRGCVAENRGTAPDFRFTPQEKDLLLALRNADRDVGMASLRRFSASEYAATEVKALNCIQCHAAGGENKLPDLTYAGEKFDRDWLQALFAGQHPKLRPWQEARMPAFASRAANLALGLAARQGAPTKTPAPEPNPELAVLGAKLAGTEGYACVACHDHGDKKALQVFEGQGPNLQLAAQRLRYDYFQRWMHWPQRIAPATIMPRYTKDRDHAINPALDGDAEKQFEAIWQWARTLHTP
jgi:mono/diheme cytochrome c family protein